VSVFGIDIQRQVPRVLGIGDEHQPEEDGERRPVVPLQVFLARPANPLRNRDRKPRDNLFADAFAQTLGEVAGIDARSLLYLSDLALG
jgi:hypothetical protein